MPASRSDEFLALLAPLRDALYRFARRSLWRREDVDDTVQDAVMTAWRDFDRFESGTNFRAWMFRVMVHAVYRANQRVRRRREQALENVHEHAAESDSASAAWLELLRDPDRLSDLLDQRLARALAGLSDVERQCLLLRLLEDYTYKEIASLLEIPMGTVMSHVHRARLRLREALAALAGEPGRVVEGRT